MENQPVQPVQVHPSLSPEAVKSNKKKLVWGLICLIAPSALFVSALVLYAFMNFISGATASPTDSGNLFAQPSPGKVVANILLFVVGIVTVLTWLPGIIIGIILLASRKK